jgi:hypothetical protein
MNEAIAAQDISEVERLVIDEAPLSRCHAYIGVSAYVDK